MAKYRERADAPSEQIAAMKKLLAGEEIYSLRLLSYEIDFDKIAGLSV